MTERTYQQETLDFVSISHRYGSTILKRLRNGQKRMFQSLIGTVQRIMITLLSIVGLINYVSISHRYGSTYYGYVRVSSNRFQSLIGTVQHIVKEQD